MGLLVASAVLVPQPVSATELSTYIPRMAQPAAPAHDAVSVAAQLEARLLARGAEVDQAVALFYLGRAYRPVWTDPERVRQLLQAIEGSEAHGLSPADYDLLGLQRELALPPGSLSPSALIDRELRLTASLALLVRHLRDGKVDPRKLYREWNYSPPAGPVEHASALMQAIAAPDLVQAIGAQAPDLALYRQLQAALDRYRRLVGAQTQWPAVPGGATLRLGDRNPRVVSLRERLIADGAMELAAAAEPAVFDAALDEAVKRFQMAHGLEADGAVGRQSIEALNTSPAQRLGQIRVNLERLRWVARDMRGDRLEVDITGFAATLHVGGHIAWSARVVVGRPGRQTPALLDSVRNLVFNPRWVVPPTILREDVIPGVVRDPDYLVSHRMRVVDRDGQPVDPEHIDWSAARRAGFPYMIVQESGADGSLGQIKFTLANRYAIFLHDTNARSLFRRASRALSSGCVRVERPSELALLLLGHERWSAESLQEALDSGKTRTVPVAYNMPVLLLYTTAGVNAEGVLGLRNDLYGLDPGVLAALEAGR